MSQLQSRVEKFTTSMYLSCIVNHCLLIISAGWPDFVHEDCSLQADPGIVAEWLVAIEGWLLEIHLSLKSLKGDPQKIMKTSLDVGISIRVCT